MTLFFSEDTSDMNLYRSVQGVAFMTPAEKAAKVILKDFDIYVKQKNILYPTASEREINIKVVKFTN